MGLLLLGILDPQLIRDGIRKANRTQSEIWERNSSLWWEK